MSLSRAESLERRAESEEQRAESGEQGIKQLLMVNFENPEKTFAFLAPLAVYYLSWK
jgi:hypothetical protein